MVNLQKDGCTFRYGIICSHVKGKSSLPEDEPSGSKRVEDILKD